MEVALLGYSFLSSVVCLLTSAYTLAVFDPSATFTHTWFTQIENWLHASVSLVLLYQQQFFLFLFSLPLTIWILIGSIPKSLPLYFSLKTLYYSLLTFLTLYL